MNNQITCPQCQHIIPLSEAFTHEIQEKFRAQAIEYTKKKDAEYKAKLEEERKKYDEEKLSFAKDLEEKTKKNIEEKMLLKLKNTQAESDDVKKKNRELLEQLTELTSTLRKMQAKMEEKDLEMEKKLNEEQGKIKIEMQKKAEEEYRFKLLEKDKQLEDTKKALAHAQRKSEQVSQQLQGEVLELELENMLRSEFHLDDIIPVGKGIYGADITQIVKNNAGRVCGSIIWETKRTKEWNKGWISKVKSDQRSSKAEYAVIISEVLPGDLKNFGWVEDVCVGNFSCIKSIGYMLRKNLLEISLLKTSQEGKSGKMENLYNYIYGTEFRQRMAAILEAVNSLQGNMEKEKRWFNKKWAEDEKNLRKFLDNTMGMSGDLEGITGKEISGMDELGLLDDGKEPEQEMLL